MADDSKSTDVGARYAQALFDLAKAGGRLAAVEADLKSFKLMRRESVDLRRLLDSPAFSAEDKTKALVAVAAAAKFDDITRKFLGLMAQNRRAGGIASAITAFEALAAAERGVASAEVTTAVKLTPAQEAGLKVRVGSRLYDASLRSKLDSLRFALKRA